MKKILKTRFCKLIKIIISFKKKFEQKCLARVDNASLQNHGFLNGSLGARHEKIPYE